MSTDAERALAMNGGEKTRKTVWPPRRLFTEEEKAAAVALFDESIETGSAFCYNGEVEEAYCREFAQFMGGGFADGVNSGTSAVYVALRALDIEPFTEVIVPPVTDPGGMMPVPLMNCIPVPADTAPNSYNMGAEQVAACITERTSAIVVAHIAGQPADLDPIMDIARAKGIPVVEDCAQSHGATYKGRYVGAIGEVGAFSTMSGKHHATGGQGGVVFTRDEATYWRARRCSDRGKPFGLQGEPSNVVCAPNLNLNDLSAAIGRVQLGRLPEIVAGCRRAAHLVAERCRDLKSVRVDLGVPGSEGAFWFLALQLDLDKVKVDIDTFVHALQAEGLPFGCHYVTPLTHHTWYKRRAVFGSSGYPWTCPLYKGNPDQTYDLPNWEHVDRTLFNIKIHERCGEQEADDIFRALAKVETAYVS